MLVPALQFGVVLMKSVKLYMMYMNRKIGGLSVGRIQVCDELMFSKITIVMYSNCQILKEVS